MKKVFTISMVLMVFLAACAPKSVPTATQAVPVTGGDQGASGQVPQAVEPTNTVEILAATANQNANCRSGPGTMYDILAYFNKDTSADIIGRYDGSTGKWYKVQLSDGTQCWVDDSVVSITGDVSTVSYLNAPPTPTAKPKPSWVGTWGTHQGLSFTDPSWIQDFNISMSMNNEGQIIFNFKAFGYTYYATGSPSADGTYMEGFAQRNGGVDKIRFRFWFVPSNSNQFQGQWYLQSDSSKNGDWCGARSGAGLPSPCRK